MVSTIQKELISQKTLNSSKTLNHFRTLNPSKALNPLLLELWVFKLFFEYQKAQYTVVNDKKNINIPNCSCSCIILPSNSIIFKCKSNI